MEQKSMKQQENSFKIGLLDHLGGAWVSSWLQDGPRANKCLQNLVRCTLLAPQVCAKIDQKSIKNRSKTYSCF